MNKQIEEIQLDMDREIIADMEQSVSLNIVDMGGKELEVGCRVNVVSEGGFMGAGTVMGQRSDGDAAIVLLDRNKTGVSYFFSGELDRIPKTFKVLVAVNPALDRVAGEGIEFSDGFCMVQYSEIKEPATFPSFAEFKKVIADHFTNVQVVFDHEG